MIHVIWLVGVGNILFSLQTLKALDLALIVLCSFGVLKTGVSMPVSGDLLIYRYCFFFFPPV